ncbi:unnamed protein product [Candidula unifasciata]|uniref:Arrestin C-terminal-like domain-containing protein n=1 Tax=Candidula unifasciata TaxID=100452 RepID=A0A8S3ZVB6_9EUPU|nr:unnamed protein product [Candidula unifasciata]
MSALEELKIVLQHDIDEQYQYQPGEIIRGNIVIKLSRPTAVRTVTLKVCGEGNVSWKTDDGDVFQAQESYVDAAKTIVDTANQDPLSLPRGTHQFSFDYLLPENIPSSYIGKYGNVTYTMRVTVNGVNSIDTSISSEPFLVLRESPLPGKVNQPIMLATQKRLWASCTFAKLHINVSLDRQGGVPGEDIFINAELKNFSRRAVTAMQAALIMKSTYRAKNNSIDFRQIGRRWTFARLTLPPYIPESKLERCDIIELDYFFQFKVELSGGSDVTLEAPLLIGSKPQGLEIPADEKLGLKINRQWTIQTEYNDGWGVEIVPEMRPEDAVIANPLFQHNLALQKGVKVYPDEVIENTKL